MGLCLGYIALNFNKSILYDVLHYDSSMFLILALLKVNGVICKEISQQEMAGRAEVVDN